MGYNTDFHGTLTFTQPLGEDAIAKLKTMLGEDCRDHPEWGAPNLSYIDLQLTPLHDGLQWDGSEKTYDLVEKVNVIITEMRKNFPGFGLAGHLVAQGEDTSDRWILLIGPDGMAQAAEAPDFGAKVICPHCRGEFRLDTKALAA